MKKYYIVPAEIMESNFPDDFQQGMYPGQSLGMIVTNMSHQDILKITEITKNDEKIIKIQE